VVPLLVLLLLLLPLPLPLLLLPLLLLLLLLLRRPLDPTPAWEGTIMLLRGPA